MGEPSFISQPQALPQSHGLSCITNMTNGARSSVASLPPASDYPELTTPYSAVSAAPKTIYLPSLLTATQGFVLQLFDSCRLDSPHTYFILRIASYTSGKQVYWPLSSSLRPHSGRTVVSKPQDVQRLGESLRHEWPDDTD